MQPTQAFPRLDRRIGGAGAFLVRGAWTPWHALPVSRTTSKMPSISLLRGAIIGALAAAMSHAVFAQSCPLYFTDFASFAGPPDFVEGDLRVQWCKATATVVGSNFCNSGSAFKLDSSGDDPIVLVAVGGAGCTAIEVSFKYAQFAASQTVLRYGTTTATAVSCTAATPLTLGALTTTGGACTAFTAVIPLNGAPGLCLRFDHGANNNAVTIDDLEFRRIGCCTTGAHPCCELGGAGCADNAVAACVCAQDPFCCSTQWDAQCVGEITQFGCGSCSGGGAPCLDVFALDFGTLYSGGSICARFPEYIESCEGTAPFLTSSLGCTAPGDMALRFSSGFPYSAAITRCVTFASRTAPALAFVYSKQTGTLGPRVDYSLDGSNWTNAWSAPIAFAGGCVPVQLDLSPLAGEASVRFRFSSGSSVSNLATFDDITVLEITNVPHACCAPGGPSCANATTSACTCAIDPYCCATVWDDVCIAIATVYCGAQCPDLAVCGSPTAGSCTVMHATAACADADCCVSVCTLDAFCCESAWDATCVQEAGAACFAAADIDRDGRVAAVDLAMVLDSWGLSGVSADIDGNGIVGAGDLAMVLSAWTG